MLFLVNSDLHDINTGTVTLNGKYVACLNTLSGKMSKYQFTNDNDRVTLSWTLPPAGSLLLYISDKEINDLKPASSAPTFTAVESGSPMKVTRDTDNAIMLDFCDIEVASEITRDIHTFYAADKVFRHYGFRNGNPWNTSVQFKRSTVEKDTFGINTGFTATYHFKINGKFDVSGMRAVIERAQLWNVTINDNEIKPEAGQWWLDRSFSVFSIGQFVKPGENIISIRTAPMKVHAEIEPVYILGDFSVSPAEKGWEIAPPRKEYTTGSWKSQGLPYYSWGMTYTREFTVDNAEGIWQVGTGKWNGTVAEVYVNGEKADPLAFPPYRADVTGLIKPGVNKVEIRVIGSLKNLQGPHHNNPAPGLTSPGSWRNVRRYPSGNEYQMIDYGLFEEFGLYRGV